MAAITPSVSERHAFVLQAVERFERPLLLYTNRLLGDLERARDVVQDTFLKLCRQQPEALDGKLAEWLYTVARNHALDVLRKEGRMARLTDEHARDCPSPDRSASDSLEDREVTERILALIDTLPANQREVLQLKFQHGFSYKEISRISGHSVSNVGFLLHVALKRVRQQLAVVESRAAGVQP